MKLGMLLFVGTVLIGASLVLALTGNSETEAGGPLPLLAEGAGGADCLYLAPGPGGRCLLKTKTAEDSRAPRLWRVPPPALSFGHPSTNGGTWVLTNSPWLRSNVWVLPRGLAPFGLGRSSGAPMVAPPGVYESAPYKGIVVVPGPQWDDRSLVFGENESAPLQCRCPRLRYLRAWRRLVAEREIGRCAQRLPMDRSAATRTPRPRRFTATPGSVCVR